MEPHVGHVWSDWIAGQVAEHHYCQCGASEMRFLQHVAPPMVRFVSTETLINALDGLAVHAISATDGDGIGILRPFRPDRFADGVFMVSFHDVVTDRLIMATDIRNFDQIDVP